MNHLRKCKIQIKITEIEVKTLTSLAEALKNVRPQKGGIPGPDSYRRPPARL